jgi:hypothetical protein
MRRAFCFFAGALERPFAPPLPPHPTPAGQMGRGSAAQRRACAAPLLLCIVGALLAGRAGAVPAKKAATKPAKPAEQVAKLDEEAKGLEKQVDEELRRLFRYQVQSGVYRNRLAILQKEWQKLFAGMQASAKPRLKLYPTPKPGDFVIDEVRGSDAESLEQALVTGNCKKRAGCRIWARISFGKELVQKGGKFEFSAELKLKSGTTRIAVPTKEMTITGPVATVDLALDALYIYKGTYEGTLKVMYGERFKSKSFSFDLIETY